MNQCLRCNRACKAPSVFCDDCRSLLEEQRRLQKIVGEDAQQALLSQHAVVSAKREGNDDFSERSTAPLPIMKVSGEHEAALQAPQTPQTPYTPQTPQPVAQDVPALRVEQVIHKLQDAARRIAEGEPNGRRTPKASRLAPLRDISSEIQRYSTPLPKTPSQGLQPQDNDLAKKMPDIWPWLQDLDADENENENEQDNWANHTDPLLARRFPNSNEIARIEAEDLRRVREEGVFTGSFSGVKRRSSFTRMRVAFFSLVVLAVLALTVDSVLISFAFLHPHRTTQISSGIPSLTFSQAGSKEYTTTASVGEDVTAHLRHFSSNAFVLLSHDVGVPVQIKGGTSFFRVGADGSADVVMVIDDAWQPSYHTVNAEEQQTHETASAILQIVNAGRSVPPSLIVNTSFINFNADYKGTSSVRPLTLSNAGTSPISWSVSSNKPWLMTTPNAGTFSQSQTIEVSVSRANLQVGSYSGKLTFSSNVGSSLVVLVEMQVRAVPANASVLSVTPPVLSFTALDGAIGSQEQMLVVSNPGVQPLSWSLMNNTPTLAPGQSGTIAAGATNWLTAIGPTSGTLVPGATYGMQMLVRSEALLPGTYINTLVFSGGQNAADTTQAVTVSLTIQPNCGLSLSTGSMSFTAVAGQSNPTNQVLGISATSSCSGVINWHEADGANWLTTTPGSGQVKSGARVVTGIAVNIAGLSPGTYTTTLLVVAAQSTQSVLVTLTVQPPPPASTPILGVSPLSLYFSTTQGQPSPPGQVVTITNTSSGNNALQWHTNVTQLGTNWLNASPSYGTVAPGQTGQLTVTVTTTNLTPGVYQGQIGLQATYGNGQSAGGSPQTISINLQVLPPCSLDQPSSSALAFSTVQGIPVTPQSLILTASGNCGWPLSWKGSVSSNTAWLGVSPLSGTFAASGQSSTVMIAPDITNLVPGTYSAQLLISANDVSGVPAQGSPQTVAVSLTVLQACTLQATPTSVAFSALQGQSSSTSQSVSISESGNCARPVSWTASGDSNSTNWLLLSTTSGTDTGAGSTFTIGFSAASLAAGTYKGTVTLSASGNGSAMITNSPLTISVTLTVTSITVKGTVYACADQTCANPKALAGAKVSVTNSSGVAVGSATANSSGAYKLSGLGIGSYTLSVTGTDASGTTYSNTMSITVSNSMTGVNINVYPPNVTPSPTS